MYFYAIINTVIWPVGVPLALIVWLARISRHLDPPNIGEEEAIEGRKEDPVVAESAIAFVAIMHRPRYWYYEVVFNLGRRLALTCVALVFDSNAAFMCFILAVSIYTIVSEREMNAHIDPYVGAFVYLMQWQILLCILAMLLMDAEMTDEIGDLTIGIVLMSVNTLMALVVFMDTRGDVIREAQEKAASIAAKYKTERKRGRRAIFFPSLFRGGDDGDDSAATGAGGSMRDSVSPAFVTLEEDDAETEEDAITVESTAENPIFGQRHRVASPKGKSIEMVTTNGAEEEKDSSTGGAEEDVMSIELVATYGAGRAEDAESDKFEVLFQHERVPATVDSPNKVQNSLHGAEIDVSFQDLESSVNRFTDGAGAQPEKRQESARMQPQSERAAPQVFEVEVDHTQDDAADELEDDYANLIEACGVSESPPAWTGSAEEDVMSIVTTNGAEEEKDSSTGGAEEDVMSIDLVATYGAGRAEDAESDKFDVIIQHERVPVTVDAPNKIQDSLHDGAEIDVSFQDLESSVNRFTDVAGAQPEKRQESARMQPQSERAAPQVFEVEVDHTQDDAADELEDDYANLIEACGVSEELMFALIEEVTQPNGHIAGARLMEILNTYQLLRDFESARAMVHKSTKSATTLWMTTDAAPKAATKLWLALGLDDSSSSGDVNFIVFSKSMSRKLGPLCPAEAELQEVYDAFKHRMDAIKDVL
jgi:hypothetical protein